MNYQSLLNELSQNLIASCGSQFLLNEQKFAYLIYKTSNLYASEQIETINELFYKFQAFPFTMPSSDISYYCCSINGIVDFSPLHAYMHRYKKIDPVKVLLKNGFDVNIQDSEGNTPMHVAQQISKITLLGQQYNIQPNLKNIHDNTPSELFLHKNAFEYAEAAVQSGSQFTRTLREEVTKMLEEFLDLSPMHTHRFQVILNILYHQVQIKEDFPQYLLKYIDDRTDYRNEPCSLPKSFLQEMSWVKNHLGKLADYLINISFERQLKYLTDNNVEQKEFFATMYNPNNTVHMLHTVLQNTNVENYFTKAITDRDVLHAGSAFIKIYADISHNLNDLLMKENAIIKDEPLAIFNHDISVYRGMHLHSLDTIESWFKYGYESYSCEKYVSNKAWIAKGSTKVNIIASTVNTDYVYQNYDFFQTGYSCTELPCGSYGGFGLTAGVVYTSTNIEAIKRFYKGTYGSGKYSIVQEFAISKDDIHLSPREYECAIHFPSIKPEKIVAVYLVDARNDKILETFVNPYLEYPVTKFKADQVINDLSHCYNFDFLEHASQNTMIQGLFDFGESAYISGLSAKEYRKSLAQDGVAANEI